MDEIRKSFPRALILVGGRGQRLSAVVSDRPKPMALVDGEPFLHWLLLYLQRQGIQKASLLAGHMADKVQEYFQNNSRYKIDIEVLTEETPLGTGGAIKKAITHYSTEDDFFVINGDTLFTLDFDLFKSEARSNLAIALRYSDNPGRYGSVELDANNRITNFIEKSSEIYKSKIDAFINGGIYYLRRDLVPFMPDGVFSFETDFLQKQFTNIELIGIPAGGRFIDIGIPEDYQFIQSHIKTWVNEVKRPALFLDRDGVIIHHLHHLHLIRDVVIYHEALEMVREARKAGWHVIVVTNQSGVARGIFSLDQMQEVNRYIDNQFKLKNAPIDGWFACPYHIEGKVKEFRFNSLQRKPQCGMFLKASESFPIDFSLSLMVGDNATDKINYLPMTTALIGAKSSASNTFNFNSHTETLTFVKKYINSQNSRTHYESAIK